MTIAVTGAVGWIGREICGWLRQRGADVRQLDRIREIDRVGFLDLMAEQEDPSWGAALRGCAAVVHCAGHVHRPVENDEERSLFNAINVEGTRKLLVTAKAAGIRRFVFVSTSAFYDWSARKPVAEGGRLKPTTAYALSKLEAENLVRGSDLDWRIARLGTVFGMGDRANFSRLARGLRNRRFILPGDGSALKSVLPIEKAGEILGRLAIDEAPHRMILNVASPEVPSLAEICRAFSKVCGLPYPRNVPLTLIKTLARVGDLAASIKPGFPLTTIVLGKLTTSTVLNVARMQEVFPDVTWSSFNESLRRAAEYYANV